MDHIHGVYDTDPHFSIDARSRIITDLSATQTSLMQYDHNSVRITFEIPREIDGHDMSKCNQVEIHYVNVGTNSQRNSGLYEVDDLKVDDNNDNTITCTWLISRNATSLVGSLSFLLRFMCTSGDIVDYVWNTAVYSAISVGNGMNNSTSVATQYADILQSWYNELLGAGSSVLSKIEDETRQSVTNILKNEAVPVLEREIKAKKDDALTAIQTQKDEIVAQVLERLPRAEGASF